MLSFTAADEALLADLRHDRLRALFPSELQDAVLLTRTDETLIISCDWETIALLNEDWDSFAHFVYVITGCDRTVFYVEGVAVLTQTRAIQLNLSASEAKAMVATVERVEQAAAPTMGNGAVVGRRSLNEIVQELAEEIALRAIAKVEASAVMVNSKFASGEFGTVELSRNEQPPQIEAAATPEKLPTVRLKGIYTPTRSNWVQSAKRYLKAVDPSGNADKRTLLAIAQQTPTGQAHLARAIREYPASDHEAAQTRLHNAFMKLATDRGLVPEKTA